MCELKPLCKRLLCQKILRDNNYFFMRQSLQPGNMTIERDNYFFMRKPLQPGHVTIEGETNDSSEGYLPCSSISVIVRNGQICEYLTSKEAFYCPQYLIMVNNKLTLSKPFFITPGDKPDSAFVLYASGILKRSGDAGFLRIYGSDLKYQESFKTGCMPPGFEY